MSFFKHLTKGTFDLSCFYIHCQTLLRTPVFCLSELVIKLLENSIVGIRDSIPCLKMLSFLFSGIVEACHQSIQYFLCYMPRCKTPLVLFFIVCSRWWGRAGRPQFDDQGKAVILVHDIKKRLLQKVSLWTFPSRIKGKFCCKLI